MERLPLSVSLFLEAVNLALNSKDGALVVGEVVELKIGAKWVSFTLKDKEEEAILKCVLGVWQYGRIGVPLEEGMEIKVSGRPSVSKRFGSFGLWIDHLEAVGEGSIKKAYELLLNKLKAEGLFVRKRPMPEFVQSVGIITSREGVVLQDFQKNLEPLGIVGHVFDSRVEGAEAVHGILAGVEYFLSEMPQLDLIIIMRGGGSLESMQAFNNETVVRALFSSTIPTVAAIGHDVNMPIAALGADSSVSTPTAAAHLVNGTWKPLTEELPILERKILESFETNLAAIRHRVSLASGSTLGGFRRIFTHIDRLEDRLVHGLRRMLDKLERFQSSHAEAKRKMTYGFERMLLKGEEARSRFERLLALLDPRRNLRLGYSIVRTKDGKITKHAEDLKKGDTITTQFDDGLVESCVTQSETT